MQTILLVEEKFGPVPPEIRVVQEFGDEMIVTDVDDADGRRIPVTVPGVSMFLEGPPEAFANWLREFDAVWISKNPMTGDWYVVHVKDEF